MFGFLSNSGSKKSSLTDVQNFYKFWNVFSLILFILSIIAFVFVSFGFVLLNFVNEFNGVSTKDLMEKLFLLNYTKQISILLTGIFVITGDAFLSFEAMKYFKKEIKEGTPFTVRGSSELMNLGDHFILVPIFTNLFAAIVSLFAFEKMPFIYCISLICSIIIGLLFITYSYVVKYASEIRVQLIDERKKTPQN